MNKFQLAKANVSDSLRDFWLQVKAKFTPGDYTREMFSTVSRGWVLWQTFLVGIFLINCAFSLADSEWYEAWLHFMIAALFALLAFWELMMNMAKKTIDNLFEVARDQQKTMHQMMDVIDPTYRAGEFD